MELLRSASLLILTAMIGSGAEAQAQAEDRWDLSLALASDYRSKGASKTGGRAGGAFGVERRLAADSYVGLSANSVRNSAGSDGQVNLSVGWRPRAFGLNWDIDSTHEIYPGSNTSGNDVVWQLSARASHEAGPLTTRMILQHQPDGFGDTGRNTFLAVDGAWRWRSRLAVVGGLGRREQDNSVDYTAWNGGLVFDMSDRLALEARYYATDQSDRGPNFEDRLVAALEVSF